MKTFFTLLLAITIIGCDKDSDSDDRTRRQLLTEDKWYFSSTETRTNESAPWTEVNTQACARDDFYVFYEDGSFEDNPGATACTLVNPLEGSWYFTESETKLVISYVFGGTYDLVELTATRLVIGYGNGNSRRTYTR